MHSSFLQKELPTNVLCRTSCLTPNVIYCITCLKCQNQYIGETKRKICKRIYEHLRTINNFEKDNIVPTPVSEHFNIQCKRPAKLRFQIIETINADPDLENTTTLRRKRESWWILTMRTIEPFGMNVHV